ncbi:MAG: hypothetical protein ACRD41_17890, partial [Candidatus Acidiferrales bacterium]
MTAGSKPPSRQLIWGGLAARCSMCGWEGTYQRGVVVHSLPIGELANAIRSEYELHKCEDYPAETQWP